jgi:hypothetical protein
LNENRIWAFFDKDVHQSKVSSTCKVAKGEKNLVSENCRKQNRKTAPLTEEMQPNFILFFKNQKTQFQLKS